VAGSATTLNLVVPIVADRPDRRSIEWSWAAVNEHHSALIDTTEMYLRTVYELEEEGVTPLRARIAERLGQSGPTVSQTVARMERDGLLHVAADRHLELSTEGRRQATAVMRKHRLAERLLLDVIGLEWDQVHIEACRWEHVMSDTVERRIIALLEKPLVCPHGNPIPGLRELGLPLTTVDAKLSTTTLLDAAVDDSDAAALVERISEQLQPDDDLMRELIGAGVLPGRNITLRGCPDGVEVDGPSGTAVIDHFTAEHIFVVLPDLA
jgi:DtxR family Mn-dependent transcriptional regulator